MDKRQIILIVGDESREREALNALLQQEGYRPLTAATTEQALDLARKHAPAVALVDLWLADLPGHVVLHGLRQAAPATECIALMTNPAQQDGAIEALKLGAFTYIRRGLDYRQLLVTIRRALEKRDAARALDDMKQRLAILFDALPAGVLIVDDRTGAVVDANPAAVKIIGAPREEIVGSLLHSRALGGVPRRAAESQPAAELPLAAPDLPITRQTGRRIPATRTVATLDIGGRLHRLESFVDVSGRMEVEDKLAAEQVVLQLLLEGVPDLVMTVAPDGTLIRLYRGSPEALKTLPGSDATPLLAAGMRDRYKQALRDACRTGRPGVFSAGTPPFESWSVRLDPIESRGIVLAAAVRARDLTGRERDAQRLQIRAAAVSHAQEPLLVFNTDGLIVDANEAAGKLFDYSLGELIGLTFQKLDHPEQPQTWSRLWASAAAHTHFTFASRYMTRDGRLLPVQVTLYHTVCAGTAVALAFVEEVEARAHTANVIANVAAREDGLLGSVLDAVWIVTRSGQIQNLNEAAARACNRSVEQVRGHAYDRMLPEDFARPRLRRVEDAFIHGASVTFEDHHGAQRQSVQISPIRDHDGIVVLAAIVARDTTDAQAQAQRLELFRNFSPMGLIDLDMVRLNAWLATADSSWRREPEGFLHEAPDRLPALLAAIDVTDANEHAVRLLRLPDVDALRAGLTARVPEHGARTLAAAFLRLLAERGTHASLEQTFTGGDGQPVHTSVQLVLHPNAAGQPRQAQLFLIDHTARHQAQSDMLDTSALERARIGAELRETLAAALQALGNTAQQLAAAQTGEDAARVTELAQQIQALGGKAEQLAQALGRGAFEEMGLMAALGRISDEAAARWGVTCRSNLRTAGLISDRALGLHLQAIASEAVDYAARRRGARQITITLSASPKEGALTVKDDGTAPDAGEPEDVNQRLIRVRADLIHGTIETERDPRGTNALTCRFPNG